MRYVSTRVRVTWAALAAAVVNGSSSPAKGPVVRIWRAGADEGVGVGGGDSGRASAIRRVMADR